MTATYEPGDRVQSASASGSSLAGTIERVIACEGLDHSEQFAYVVQWDDQPPNLLVYADWQLAPVTQTAMF